MFKKEDIFSKHKAHIYKDFDSIVSELKKVKEYNIRIKDGVFVNWLVQLWILLKISI